MNNQKVTNGGISDLDDFLNGRMSEVEKIRDEKTKEPAKKEKAKEKSQVAKIRPELEGIFQLVGEYESSTTAISKEHARKLQFLSTYSHITLSRHISVRKLLHNILSEFFDNHAEALRELEDEFRKGERIF